MSSVINLVLKYIAIWRWALVGLTTTTFDFLIFISIYSSIKSVLIANSCAGLFSISFNYLAHYFWSFKSELNHSKSTRRYLINLIIFWSLGTLLLKILITLEIDPKLAKLLPILFIAPLSFLSLSRFVFRKLLN